MKFGNYMILEFPSKSCNESFARSAVACFAAQMDPTLEELGDIRTAVSDIRVCGRSSQGVIVMRTSENGKVISLARTDPEQEDETETEDDE